MDLHATKKRAHAVHGWLTEKEGALLYGLANECTGKGVIVEIGSWQGKSALFLGAGSQAGNKVPVYAIDPHTGLTGLAGFERLPTFPIFQNTIKKAGLDSIVKPLVMTSAEAAVTFNTPIELLFIDGDHALQMVSLDYTLWFPRLINGGIIAFHDTCSSPEILAWPGPVACVKKNIYQSKQCRNIRIVDTITAAQKTSRASILDQCKNRIMLVRRALQSLIFILRHFCVLSFKKIKNIRSHY